MLVCPLCRLTLSDTETACPRDGNEGVEATLPDVPAVVRARFNIVQPYARGASGDLFLADDQQTGRRGVLKLLRLPENVTPAEKARLKRELVKQGTLSNPALATPMATGDAGGIPWLFREWIEGVSLRVKLARAGALTVPEALSIAAQVAAALDELHRSGLLHRDIKPGHIILNPQPTGLPRVAVIDAGIAARIETSSVFDVTGTPEYVSPEQAKGKLVSFRSDLYSLGCVIFEMLTGTTPFDGTPAEQLEAHADRAAPTPQVSIPTGVTTLLSQLLAKEPRERPFSAQQVRRALEPFLPEDANSKRDATQTFEKMTEKRRAPVAGSGTLRPPKTKTKLGMPSRPPPPPPKATKKPTADGTEELSALDLEEAEEIASAPKGRRAKTLLGLASPKPAAGGTEELSALDLEEAEEVLAGASAKSKVRIAPPSSVSVPSPAKKPSRPAPSSKPEESPPEETEPAASAQPDPSASESVAPEPVASAAASPSAAVSSPAVSAFAATAPGVSGTAPPVAAAPAAGPASSAPASSAPAAGPAASAPAASGPATPAPVAAATSTAQEPEAPAEGKSATQTGGFETAASKMAPPWEQTRFGDAGPESPATSEDPSAPVPVVTSEASPEVDEGLDYDDLAETKAVDRGYDTPIPTPVPARLPSDEVPTGAYAPAGPSTRPAAAVAPSRRSSKGPLWLLLVAALAGMCAVSSVLGGVILYLTLGDDEEPVAVAAPVSPSPSAWPAGSGGVQPTAPAPQPPPPPRPSPSR